MQLDKFTPLTTFLIFAPRWHDKTVLLSASKVNSAMTKYLKVVFTKAPTMNGDWVVDKTDVKRLKKETNGTIQCYVVPLKLLIPLTINERSLNEAF